jgi:ABC-type transporter Mla subunit MlaD
MRRILSIAAVLLAVGAFLFLTLGSSSAPSGGTYRVELQNAFGLVSGEDFRVNGVNAGTIQSIDLCEFDSAAHCEHTLDSVVTVSVNRQGFNQFYSDTFCQSRPQSLIGEYFLDCEPGSRPPALKPGSTIPVSQTQSTIPADLVQSVLQLPYRQRLTLIINELGAAVAARSIDIQSALRRADPALAETDNLLALLANDANTIKTLNVGANQVVSALAVNNRQVQRFIVEANNASQAAASPQANPASCGTSSSAHCIEATWNKLPGFLTQLRPALAKLGAAADAQAPVFNNLNAAANNLQRFFVNLTPFAHEAVPSLQSLGRASVTGKSAVQAASPTVADLQKFTGPVGCDQQSNQIFNCTPELAQNLAIVLKWLDSRSHAIERDPRSPDGGAGYTGLEGLLEYAFNLGNAINMYTPWGHELAVDLAVSPTCSLYATPQTIANSLSNYEKAGGNLNSSDPANPRTCYSWLGPNQPGINESDPSWTPQAATPANPSPCVPDPGGYPVQYGTNYYGPKTNACRLSMKIPTTNTPSPPPLPPPLGAADSAGASRGGGGGGSSGGAVASNRSVAAGQLVSRVGSSGVAGTASNAAATTGTASGEGNGAQAAQLLNYLLAP